MTDSVASTPQSPAGALDPAAFRPLFIVGGSRTGSEMLLQLIFNYTPINMCQEMHLLSKPWLRKDYAGHVASLGDPGRPGYAERLADLMYSKTLHGVFWKRNMPAIQRDRLIAALEQTDFSLPQVFRVLMELHAETNDKPVAGAKFPLHLSHSHRLVEWFPDCRIINTIRDPRATFSSQASKHHDKGKSSVANQWMNVKQMVHMSMQFRDGVQCHEQLKDHPGYLLWRYEDLVSNPRDRLMHLCEFLEVPFNEEMLSPALRDNSSFTERGAKTGRFNEQAIQAWKKRISPAMARTIRLINRSAMNKMGYSA